MRVLLDWLGQKVAVLNLLQIQIENGTPQFFHPSVVDLINDKVILLLNVLKLEKHGRERAGLNHFNLVSGREPVESLQDFLPVGVANATNPFGARELRLRMAQHGEPGSATNNVIALNRILITGAEALVSLRSVDVSTVWGPSRSCFRRQRRDRLKS